jgi:hypothetical protein
MERSTMKSFTFIVGLMLTSAAHADWYLFTSTPYQTNGITVIDVRVPVGRNDDLKQYVFDGFPVPAMSQFPCLVHAPTRGMWSKVTSAQIDSRDALLAEYKSTLAPEVHHRPQESPDFIVNIGTKGIGISATEDGDLYTYRAHSSPYESTVALSNRLAAAKALQDHKDAIKAIKLDLLQCETNIAQVAQALENINTSATGTLGVAISAINPALLTGNAKTVATAQRDALTATRNVLGDFKTAIKNLRQALEQNRQAAEKLRREVR